MSVKVVVPPSSISRRPKRGPQRTNSGETFFASAGKMNFSSQSWSFRSSAIPRNSDMAAWVWVLMSPGARMASGRSRRCFGWKRASISALVPTATMRSPRMATAPFSMTRCRGSSVMTYRALQIQSAGSAKSTETKRKKLQIRNIEWLRKEIFETIGFGFAVKVHQHDLDIPTELPENLPAGAAGRGQTVGIGGHRHPAELAHTLGDPLKKGDTLGADGEAVRGVFAGAPGVNVAVDIFQRRADFEFGEGREGVLADGQSGGKERVVHEFSRAGRGAALKAAAPMLSGNAPGCRAPWLRFPALPRDGSSAAKHPPPYW